MQVGLDFMLFILPFSLLLVAHRHIENDPRQRDSIWQKPLEKSIREIRLLILEPSESPDGPLHGRLEVTSLDR